MHKLLIILCLFGSIAATAQTTNIVVSDSQASGSAINIAVSNADYRDGDDLFSEADRTEKQGDLFNALTLFGKAAFEYNTSHQFNNYGSALMRMSNVHYLLKNFTEAEQVILNVALKNYNRMHNQHGEMDSYKQLAKIYLASDKLTEALWFSTQQGILARQLKSNNAYIDSILGIANVKIKKKQYTSAKKDLNQAELLAKTTKNSTFRSQISYARNQIAAKQMVKKS
jgi:tetratricopeptide (TPR) repeat protein